MYEELVKIRQFLEEIKDDSILLKNFPRGRCGATSYLVATYLESLWFGEFDYILGKNNDETKTHAWLLSVRNNHIVDITADQFGFDKIIYIAAADYPLLELFPQQENRGNASIFSKSKVNQMYHLAYKKLLKQLDK